MATTAKLRGKIISRFIASSEGPEAVDPNNSLGFPGMTNLRSKCPPRSQI